MKVCHVTSAHTSGDIRIFIKECCSLSNMGYDVYLVAQGESREDTGVRVIGVGGKPTSRIKRIMCFTKHVYSQALFLNCDVYHIHDPELLPYGLKLKKAGKKVIFDSHEDVPAQIRDKQWIPKVLRGAVAAVYRTYETYVVKRLDAVVAATPHIAKCFKERAKYIAEINNFPKLDDIKYYDRPFIERDAIVCYAGGINVLRGETVMIEAMRDVPGTLLLAGEYNNSSLSNKASNIKYLGLIDRNAINELYEQSVVGLVVLMPTANYVNSQPIKMYEYMAAGLPFVCSNFDSWHEVVEKTGAGICVPPMDIEAVRHAIKTLLSNREMAQMMGRKGREAVIKQYNWKMEEKRLCDLYEKILYFK